MNYSQFFRLYSVKLDWHFWKNYIGNQMNYIILHVEEYRVRCYLIAVWRRDASRKMYPTRICQYLGLAVKGLIEIWKSLYSNQTRWSFSTNKEIVLHSTEYIKLYQLFNAYQFTSKPQNIRHWWPAVFSFIFFTISATLASGTFQIYSSSTNQITKRNIERVAMKTQYSLSL